MKKVTEIEKAELLNAVKSDTKLHDSMRRLLLEHDRFKQALNEIAEYDVADRHGFCDEWNTAASFNDCQEIARKTLS